MAQTEKIFTLLLRVVKEQKAQLLHRHLSSRIGADSGCTAVKVGED
jgi:hypothetical protein